MLSPICRWETEAPWPGSSRTGLIPEQCGSKAYVHNHHAEVSPGGTWLGLLSDGEVASRLKISEVPGDASGASAA